MSLLLLQDRGLGGQARYGPQMGEKAIPATANESYLEFGIVRRHGKEQFSVEAQPLDTNQCRPVMVAHFPLILPTGYYLPPNLGTLWPQPPVTTFFKYHKDHSGVLPSFPAKLRYQLLIRDDSVCRERDPASNMTSQLLAIVRQIARVHLFIINLTICPCSGGKSCHAIWECLASLLYLNHWPDLTRAPLAIIVPQSKETHKKNMEKIRRRRPGFDFETFQTVSVSLNQDCHKYCLSQ